MSVAAGTEAWSAEPSTRPGVDLDPARDQPIEDGRARRRQRLGSRGLWASMVTGGIFLAVALPLLWFYDSGVVVSPLVVAMLVGAYALAYNVEFEVGPGLRRRPSWFSSRCSSSSRSSSCRCALRPGMMLGNVLELVEGGSGSSGCSAGSARRVTRSARCSCSPRRALPRRAMRAVLVLVAALAAQFAVDFVIATVARGGWRSVFAAALHPRPGPRLGRGCDPRADRPAGGARGRRARAAFLLVLPLVGLLRTFARERRSRVDHALELSHAYRGTALLLGDVVEADDAYTGSHSRDVVSLSIAVAEELGVDSRGRRDTEFVALLHDVGKIRIPNEIINKPGPLTPEERAIVETHTVMGEEMLDRVGGVLGNVGQPRSVVPRALRRRRLPRWPRRRRDPARRSDRLLLRRLQRDHDRPALPRRAVRGGGARELRRCRGDAQFDPDVVEALARVEPLNARL